MNIGIVCYPTFGGSGVVATELGIALAEKGHHVHFITYERPVRLHTFSPNLHFHPVRPEPYPLFEFVPYESALVSKIVDVARHAELDLVHVHYAIPHASAAYMARQILAQWGRYLPVVTSLHGTDITLVGQDESYAPVVAFSINQSDGVTCVSDYLRNATLDNFSIQKAIDVIPNFIDPRRFDVGNPAWKRLSAGTEPVLLHISNFRAVKRVGDVLEVFRRVREKMPVKLLMVGDGPERPGLFQHVRELGLLGEVLFMGTQESVEFVLPMGDVFVMPSENESFGLAALEAMAAGLPVIGTRAGGLPELVEHGVSGFLSPIGHVDDMAHNTLQLLKTPESLKQFGDAARRRAAVFEQNRIVPLYEQVYERVLAHTPSLA